MSSSYTESFVFVRSDNRQSGSVNNLQLSKPFSISQPSHIKPVSFRGRLFVENVNTYNNTFTVNGVVITLTPGQYSIATFMVELKAELDLALGPIVFTVTNVSTFTGSNFRLRIQATAPYTIDDVTPQFTHLTGIEVSGATVDTTFGYMNLAYTDYFDVTSHEICQSTPIDQVAGKEVNSVLFRVPFDQFSMEIDEIAINDQSGKKDIMTPFSLLSNVSFILIDMFGQVLQSYGRWYVECAVCPNQI